MRYGVPYPSISPTILKRTLGAYLRGWTTNIVRTTSRRGFCIGGQTGRFLKHDTIACLGGKTPIPTRRFQKPTPPISQGGRENRQLAGATSALGLNVFAGEILPRTRRSIAQISLNTSRKPPAFNISTASIPIRCCTTSPRACLRASTSSRRVGLLLLEIRALAPAILVPEMG